MQQVCTNSAKMWAYNVGTLTFEIHTFYNLLASFYEEGLGFES